MAEEMFIQNQEQEYMGQKSGAANGDSKDIIKNLALMNQIKWFIFLFFAGFFVFYQIWCRMSGKGSSALRKGGVRPPTRAEALLKMLKANNYPAAQLGSLENTVVNQDVKSMTTEDWITEQKKRDDRRKVINRPKRSVGFALDNNKTVEFKKLDIVQCDDRVIKSAERNVPSTPGRLVKLNQVSSTAPAADDAQQSDAASGVDSQSGVGSEMNDQLGEDECGGEATTTIIEEINNKNEEHSPEREEKKIVEEVKKVPAPVEQISPVVSKKSGSKGPQGFEEESKVHEDLSSDETSESQTNGVEVKTATAIQDSPAE